MSKQRNAIVSTEVTQEYLTRVISQFKNTRGVHLNLQQDIIVTTEDRMRLCLNDHLTRMGRRQLWVAPLGLVLTLVTVMATSSFREAFGVGAEGWRAIFILLLVLSSLWLLIALFQLSKSCGVEDVIVQLKIGVAPDPPPHSPPDLMTLQPPPETV